MVSVEKIAQKNTFLTLILTQKPIAELFRQIAEFFYEMWAESPRDLATVLPSFSLVALRFLLGEKGCS